MFFASQSSYARILSALGGSQAAKVVGPRLRSRAFSRIASRTPFHVSKPSGMEGTVFVKTSLFFLRTRFFFAFCERPRSSAVAASTADRGWRAFSALASSSWGRGPALPPLLCHLGSTRDAALPPWGVHALPQPRVSPTKLLASPNQSSVLARTSLPLVLQNIKAMDATLASSGEMKRKEGARGYEALIVRLVGRGLPALRPPIAFPRQPPRCRCQS